MTQENDDTKKSIDQLVYATIELRAKCDALRTMLRVLLINAGADPALVLEKLRVVEATFLQKYLQIVEDHDPSFAAELDSRASLDVDWDFLKKIFPRS